MFIWYAAGGIVAISIAWFAALLQITGNAPVGLFSLGVGTALGSTLAGLAAILRIAGRQPIVVGTLLLALVTVLAEHGWLYHDFRRQWQEERASSATVAMFRAESPPSVREYFAAELTPRRAAFWVADAVLAMGAAVGVVVGVQGYRR